MKKYILTAILFLMAGSSANAQMPGMGFGGNAMVGGNSMVGGNFAIGGNQQGNMGMNGFGQQSLPPAVGLFQLENTIRFVLPGRFRPRNTGIR